MKERYEQIIRSHGVYRAPIEKLAAALQARHYDEAERLLLKYRPYKIAANEVRSAFASPHAQVDSYLSMCAALGAAYRSQSVKTVKDAVDDHSRKWPSPRGDKLYFHKARCKYMCLSKPLDESQGYYFICTREGFEAEVKRQEPEWTHTAYGDPVKIVVPESDAIGNVVVLNTNGRYGLVEKDYVLKRKPTIPASTAWDLVTERGYTVEQVKQEFEVKL